MNCFDTTYYNWANCFYRDSYKRDDGDPVGEIPCIKYPKTLPVDYSITSSSLLLSESAGIKRVSLGIGDNLSFQMTVQSSSTTNTRFSSKVLRRRLRRFLNDPDAVDNMITSNNVKESLRQEYYSFLLLLIKEYYQYYSKKSEKKDSILIGYCRNEVWNDRGVAFDSSGMSRIHYNDYGDYYGYCEVSRFDLSDRLERRIGDFDQTLSGTGMVIVGNIFSLYGSFNCGWTNGLGSSVFTSGFISCGNYVDGKKTGYTCCVFADGEYYCGGIQNGKKNGIGVSKISNVSEGVFIDDTLERKVSIMTPEGADYVGYLKDHRPSGNGYMANADNNTLYEGSFSNGLYHGSGQLITLGRYSISVEKGIFNSGQRK